MLVDDNDSPCGIIDFGDMVYSYIACEPAVCMAYVTLEMDKPMEAIAQVLKGFHDRFPLNSQELFSIIYMVCIRLCITVTMASFRKKLFPENEYIIVTEEKAWDFLKKMRKEKLEIWSQELMKHAES